MPQNSVCAARRSSSSSRGKRFGIPGVGLHRGVDVSFVYNCVLRWFNNITLIEMLAYKNTGVYSVFRKIVESFASSVAEESSARNVGILQMLREF